MNETANEYLTKLKLAFPVFKDKEKRFYDELKSSILNYVADNPDCTIDDLNDTFGEPKDVAVDYFDNMNSSVYFTLMSRAKYIQRAVTALIIFLVLLLVIYSIYFQFAFNETKKTILSNEDKIIYDEAVLYNDLED